MSKLKLSMSRDDFYGARAPKEAKESTAPERRPERRTRSAAKNEVTVLNDYEVYGQIGEMKLFVDPMECSGFTIVAGETRLQMKEALEDLKEFTYKGEQFRLGKPTRKYKEFLKGDHWIDVDVPVIFNGTILNISEMKRQPLVDRVLLNDKSCGLVIAGNVFFHEEMEDNSQFVTGNILRARKMKVGGAEVLQVVTVDGANYILTEKCGKEPQRVIEEDKIERLTEEDVEIL
ncbi:MAG: hypothetical protein Q4D02_03350 [Clostridia bacterium]|nr:hypothetical protein [Clostridia bacterium]